ncbi:MAG: precorrin-2 dehydrogenase/sirohydrochlorin ferrochelatase family protein, partial [Egibacteraceae bacterium]
VAADAAALAILCVRTDRDGDGTADVPATVRRGPVTIAVSSGVPALSRWLRAELDAAYGPELGEAAELLAELRRDPAVHRRLAGLDDAGRRAAWRSIPVPDILRLIRTGDVRSAREAALACLSSSSG